MAWPRNVCKADLQIQWFCGSGAGGQRRNRKRTACRIRHVPTGLYAECQVHAHGHRNLRGAFKGLAAQLVPLMREAALQDAPEALEKPERVRSYHEGRQEVKDTRLPGHRFDLRAILYGDGLHELLGLLREDS